MPGSTSQLGMGGSPRVVSLPAGLSPWFSNLQVRGPRVATASGSMTSGTWKTLLSITNSAGALKLLAAQATNATAKGLSVRITRDGTEILNAASAGNSGGDAYGLVAYGSMVSDGTTGQAFAGSDLLFDSSLLIEVKATVTETDGWNFYLNYDLRA